MKSPESEASPYVFYSGETLSLGGEAALELLEAVVNKGVSYRTSVRGFSMSPFIKDGDVIIAQPITTLPRVGEVVAFRHPRAQRLVVHRVVQTRPDACRIRGDAVRGDDGWVPRDNILARVARVERNGKRVRLGMGPERALIAFVTRTGIFLRVIIPIWMRIRPLVRRNRRSA